MSFFISWLLFGRLSMARIERDLARNGLPRPCSWDGPGARIMWYAYAIALPVGRFNRTDDPVIDVLLIKNNATQNDQWRAWYLIISFLLIFSLGIYGWWVGRF